MNDNIRSSGEHWAILTKTRITIPGDERSCTNPGHGYPESTVDCITYKRFSDEKTFLAELQEKVSGYDGDNSWGIHVTGVYTKEIIIAVKRST